MLEEGVGGDTGIGFELIVRYRCCMEPRVLEPDGSEII